MSTTSKADLTAERMARRVCSRLVGWLSRRVDDVHSGDAGVGSREGDDAGQFVTVEYAKAWVPVDVEDFEAFGGCGLGRQSAQEAGYAATSLCLCSATVCGWALRASVLLADEGVRMSVVGLRWPMPLPIDDMVGEESSAR
jgi:hypothetical protein